MTVPTICLTMIVRNESSVIRRCIESVKPWLNAWAIVDTGSDDGTQDLIRELLRDVPGELIERPWRDFSHNRNQALALAAGRADYLLLMDADDVLKIPEGWDWPEATRASWPDQYLACFEGGALSYWRNLLLRDGLPWQYVGVLHEAVTCAVPVRSEALHGPRVLSFRGGARSRVSPAEKYGRDAVVLEAALREEPDNDRYRFYLAQSYRDAGQRVNAIAAYRHFLASGAGRGVEQRWYAWLQLGDLLVAEDAEAHEPEAVSAWLSAHQACPERAEALYRLGRHYRAHGRRWVLAHLFLDPARHLRPPVLAMTIEDRVYRWQCLEEYAAACYGLGRDEDARAACAELLAREGLPPKVRAHAEANLLHIEQTIQRSHRRPAA